MNRRKAIKGLGLSLGYVVSVPAAFSIMESCTAKSETWATVFFNEKEQQMVTYLVDIILPATDTPGGLDVNLPQFVDMMCQDTLRNSDKELFHKGSEVFAVKFREKFDRDIAKGNKKEVQQLFSAFFDLDETAQEKVKYLMYKNVNDLEAGQTEAYNLYKFLMTVRSLSLLGYFTSEKIGKEVLSFDPIPGQYKPCIPVEEVGNAWTI